MRIFVPLEKYDEEKRLAIGYASTPALDSQGEIVKREAVEAALPVCGPTRNSRASSAITDISHANLPLPNGW